MPPFWSGVEMLSPARGWGKQVGSIEAQEWNLPLGAGDGEEVSRNAVKEDGVMALGRLEST